MILPDHRTSNISSGRKDIELSNIYPPTPLIIAYRNLNSVTLFIAHAIPFDSWINSIFLKAYNTKQLRFLRDMELPKYKISLWGIWLGYLNEQWWCKVLITCHFLFQVRFATTKTYTCQCTTHIYQELDALCSGHFTETHNSHIRWRNRNIASHEKGYNTGDKHQTRI